jgi:uncharacterized membrane protein
MISGLRRFRSGALLSGALLVAACNDPPGAITRDTTPFDAVAQTASISALGTEPFWALEVSPTEDGYEAVFTTPQDMEGEPFAVSRFAGNNGLSFSGELAGEAFQLALTPGECSDGMSDRTYPYTATVRRGEETLYGCAHTSDEPFTGPEAP